MKKIGQEQSSINIQPGSNEMLDMKNSNPVFHEAVL
jgi:hypothetical protein